LQGDITRNLPTRPEREFSYHRTAAGAASSIRQRLESPASMGRAGEEEMDFGLVVSFVVIGLMLLSSVADAVETLASRRARGAPRG